jgi:hypothetical protein
MSDEEMSVFVPPIDVSKVSFSQKRMALEIRNKYLKQFNKQKYDNMDFIIRSISDSW